MQPFEKETIVHGFRMIIIIMLAKRGEQKKQIDSLFFVFYLQKKQNMKKEN